MKLSAPTLVVGFWLIAGPAAGPGQDSPPESAAGFKLRLLPRSFQKTPEADLYIITEMTPAGRAKPAPTDAAPAYYLSRPSGQLALGLGAAMNNKPMSVDQLEKMMEASLAEAHYLPAKDPRPPDLVIVYSWGAFSAPLGQRDPPTSMEVGDDGEWVSYTNMGESSVMMMREMVERAKIIGGEAFAKEWVQALKDEARLRAATPANALDSMPSALGTAGFSDLRPMERFRNRNPKVMGMLDDIAGSIYFVIASAYEAAPLAAGQRVLLWRTKMSTRSTGLNLAETMPTLIATAAPYFGKDMKETESRRFRIDRTGNVRLAPLEVLDAAGTRATPSAESGKGK